MMKLYHSNTMEINNNNAVIIVHVYSFFHAPSMPVMYLHVVFDLV